MIAIHWFRRDLRLHDNPALLKALQQSDGQVVPLFILDDAILQLPDTGAARVTFLLDTLRALDADLRAYGSRLIVRRGQAIAALLAVAEESQATHVYWNRDYSPLARRRDEHAAVALRECGIAAIPHDDVLICPPNTIHTKQGTPYTVFTPYRRAWRAWVDEHRSALRSTTSLPTFRLVSDSIGTQPIPTGADLGVIHHGPLPPGGEQAGLARLMAFAANRGALMGYAQGRDMLAEQGTSQLSAYLRLGCVAPQAALRMALQALEQSELQESAGQSIETWISELAWRDFYYQIMYHFPHVLRSAFKPSYDQITWENRPEWFAAWCAGATGYPIVDAAMRQLRQEAWMHNRARMIVASFLTKDLLIDWRWGERYFMQQLVDGDPAANNGGWQWAAGTGTDAQPYFRIFNPTSQGQKFDPQGAYVRRYLPELAKLPTSHIHMPWMLTPNEQRHLGVQLGVDYPRPLVDHGIQRTRALATYQAARAEPAAE